MKPKIDNAAFSQDSSRLILPFGFQNNTIQHAIVSSPHQKSFFILRIFEDSDIMYLDINNKDEIGSIEKISQVIKTHRGNVLTGTAQIESFSGTSCHYYVLIQCDPNESVNILKGLSLIEQVPRIIVYNCSPKNRSEIDAQLRNFPKIEIVSKNRVKAYLAQRYRRFLERHNLSRENIISQLAMGFIISFFKLLFYGTSLALVVLLSKILLAIGVRYFFDFSVTEGIKAWLDWM
ncbi:MAG: hypothetical protein BGO21_19730 [Dyadobacter sp. 50-39]|uniref:hypothetical protein n=1 Tax=Dyadobacter sp. 50-39 TaxID=1895756 RepID=UPI0009613B2A|nr:hypothetical protein [Dyadobacter sp. 50-39]OJV14907.1 MAG: hypothetical protein BGO21_19730 [Dyadobacter sp. 50-39]